MPERAASAWHRGCRLKRRDSRVSPSPSRARQNMRRQKAVTMKFFKQLIIAFVASCVLAVGAMADEPQKNDKQKPPQPPPREGQKVPNPPKDPPPPRNDNGNKGNNDGKRGGKP